MGSNAAIKKPTTIPITFSFMQDIAMVMKIKNSTTASLHMN